ncbi:MAG: ornithine carbamoyltransferase [Deltaproteobacteria bacterium HGW-Deltaproteobacteria-14]|nr:MAG: ornithine carbamoyltransferase [Deltaproteobacteria bacterium HGW-Deltaproteobacteria-14]
MNKDLVTIFELEDADVADLLALAKDMKANPGAYRTRLAGQTLAMIFEKSSTRTRVSFEVGINQLGGTGLFLSSRDIQLGRGEPLSDTARVLSRYVDGIMARTFAHQSVVDLATYASVPVINGLTDFNHPCQALADLQTIAEHHGDLRGRKLAYVGDGNNVAHSLMMACARTGMDFACAAPSGYRMDADYVAKARALADRHGVTVVETTSPAEAVAGAHVVYSDVWASMGQEAEQKKREQDFVGFQVDQALMAQAASGAIFMHCLPAHRGEEVSAEVCDGPQSVIYDQAENRMHMQKAIMLRLMER